MYGNPDKSGQTSSTATPFVLDGELYWSTYSNIIQI